VLTDRLLFGLTGAVWAVALLLGIGLLLSARNPYGPAFSHPLTLGAGVLVGFSIAVLTRSCPAPARVAIALVALAIAVFVVAVGAVILLVHPSPAL
jgi:hypothetical protein